MALPLRGTEADERFQRCNKPPASSSSLSQATSPPIPPLLAAAFLTRHNEGLSRVSWKLSRTVLRGAVGGNAARLLDVKLDAKNKQPFAIAMKDGQPYALAGLWEKWKDRKAGTELLTFTVITTDPNEIVEPLHDRMPVIIPSKDYESLATPR